MTPSSPSARKPTAISVSENFARRPFMLSARGVERIYDIIAARLEGKPAFEVEYSNGTKLRDVDLESLLSDENSKRRSIERINCLFESAQSDRFDLTFDSHGQTPIQLTVTSTDRDRVWLTVEELRDYVSNDVASRAPNLVRRVGIPCATAVFCWLILWRVPPSVQLPRLAEVIKSPDANVKLNYFLQRQYDSGGLPFATFLTLVAVLSVGLVATLQALSHGEAFAALIPRNHFAIGGGAQRYQESLRLRGRIFWGVCVALVVSVLADVLVLLLFPKPT